MFNSNSNGDGDAENDPVLPPDGVVFSAVEPIDDCANDSVLPTAEDIKAATSAAATAPKYVSTADASSSAEAEEWANDPVLPEPSKATPKPTGPVVTGTETGHKEHAAASAVTANASSTAGSANEDSEMNDPCVFDIGSSNCRAGLASGNAPTVNTPACLWKDGNGNTLIGDAAVTAARAQEKEHELVHPVNDGLVTDWDQYESLLFSLYYYELLVVPENTPSVFVDRVLPMRGHEERKLQIVMESFLAPAMQSFREPTVAAFGAGYETALSVTLGGGVVQIAPVMHGLNLNVYATRMADSSGRHLTDYLVRMMYEEGRIPIVALNRWDANYLKEKLCYVAKSKLGEYGYSEAIDEQGGGRYFRQKYHGTLHEFSVRLGRERFAVPEMLFNPQVVKFTNDFPGLSEQIIQVVQRMPGELRPDMYANVAVTGGGARLPGIAERIQQDLIKSSVARKVVVRAHTHEAAWQGAAICAVDPALKHHWISKAEYDEAGPSIVHRKLAF